MYKRQILAHRGAGGNFRDCAVLYRMNAQSNRLEFAFKTDAGPLNYLKNRSFSVAKVGFAEKYFPDIRF